MMFDNCENVRMATPEDCQEIYRLMVLAWEECGDSPFSQERVCQRIWAAVNRQASMIGVIGSRGEELKAYIYMEIGGVWYSDAMQLTELSTFVAPEHRRSNFAKQLISFAKKCADGLNLDLMIGVVSNERTQPKVRLYRRQLPPVGAYFMYHPNTGEVA